MSVVLNLSNTQIEQQKFDSTKIEAASYIEEISNINKKHILEVFESRHTKNLNLWGNTPSRFIFSWLETALLFKKDISDEQLYNVRGIANSVFKGQKKTVSC